MGNPPRMLGAIFLSSFLVVLFGFGSFVTANDGPEVCNAKRVVLVGPETKDMTAWKAKSETLRLEHLRENRSLQWIEANRYRWLTDDTGTWEVADTVKLKADNPKLLAWATTNTTESARSRVIVNGKDGRTNDLLSKVKHGDVRAHVEFMMAKQSNAGVYLQGRYEVQILDSWGVEKPSSGDCGGIYGRGREAPGRPKSAGSPPRVNASKRPGMWQTYDIVFRAPRFDEQGKKIEDARFLTVHLNGKLVQKDVSVSGPTASSTFEEEEPTGPFMLQGHHGPVAFRNIWFEPVDTDRCRASSP